MSFDGVLLNKLKSEFDILKTGRISKIVENGTTDFILTIRANRTNYNLMLSFSSDYARIHLTDKLYDVVLNPKSFTMLLRKHIEGYFIEDILTHHNDRVIYFKLTGYNEMQDKNTKYLICEVMGRYSNMILTDSNYKIIEALKHDGIGEYNRTILPNTIYEFPVSNKLNPFDYTKEELVNIIKENKVQTPKDYMNLFNGVSMNLSNPIFRYDNHYDKFYEYLHISPKPVIFKNYKDKIDFYYHPFEHEILEQYDSISSLLDNYYYKADLQAKVRLKTNDLTSFVSRQLNKLDKKIVKLEADLRDSLDSYIYKLYGELLLSYPKLHEKINKVTVLNYYDNTHVTIDLDPKVDVISNSSKYYKKYQKSKNAVSHIKEQITLTQNEIEYFNVLKYQLENASINEAIEIQDELIEGKYLIKNVSNKNKKKLKPKLLTYILDNNTLISVGKNNTQNEYLTHKLATPNEMWFHIKDGAGSHVVVHNTNVLTEEEIRTAATLAAYYSTYSSSSSVQVDYTKIRNIKKIPGKKNCFVTYTNQKTIYIDPDIKFIEKLRIKK